MRNLDRHLGTVHLVWGVLMVIAFVLTGQYMDKLLDHLVGMEDVQRMLYRSTHLYILYAGLLNGVAGINWTPYDVLGARLIRGVGSILLLAVPALLLAGFFTEPELTGLARPFTRPATYTALASGTALLAAYGIEWDHRRARGNS